MEQSNNKIISKITDFINKNSSKTTKTYIIFTILAGILTLIPVSTFILEAIDLNKNINENIYIISFYIVKIIGFLIYFCVLKEMTDTKKITSILAIISMFMSGFIYNQMNSTESTGIDGIGQALIIGMIFGFLMFTYYILTVVLFILYAKKFIFKKKAIITIIMIIVLIILFVVIAHYSAIKKINNNIPSASDFENELIKRNLYTEEYLLFGVDNIENNIHKIDFDNDSNKKYPSYIYYGYKTKNLSKNISRYDDNYFNWIIYYTNGKIYATLVDYDDSQSFQKYYSIEILYDSKILSEDDDIYTYNLEKNYYDKIDINKDGLSTESLRYYYKKDTYISIDVLKKFPCKFFNYEIIDKIDSNTLDNYANNLKK